MKQAESKPSLLVLASGRGSTFAALIEAEKKLLLDMRVKALIVDRDCAAIEIARENGVPVHVISFAQNKETFAARLHDKIQELNANFILLAGFLRKVPDETVRQFSNRIFNTHPSLLPDFGGAGMYGINVHKAVIASKATVSGISFHYVTEVYDQGGVIAQKQVLVADDTTPEALEEKLKSIEKFFVIEQLNAQAVRFRRS